jgi:hypothetical protein
MLMSTEMPNREANPRRASDMRPLVVSSFRARTSLKANLV